MVVSFILLKKNEPELARPLNIRGGVKFGVLILIVTCMYFILYMRNGLKVSLLSPEFVITIIWLFIGILMVITAKWRRNGLTVQERELLVFGERFARKGGKYEK